MSKKTKRYYFYRLQNGLCAYCFTQMTMKINQPNTCTLDHVVPRSEGGPSTIFNLVGACAKCNGEKSNKPLAVFLALREAAKLAI